MIKTIKPKDCPKRKGLSQDERSLLDCNALNAVASAYISSDSVAAQPVVRVVDAKRQGYLQQDSKKGWTTVLGIGECLEKLVASKMNCFYCSKPTKLVGETVRDPLQWTFDRIDNDRGHTIDNVVVACLDCNLRRRTTDQAKFLFTQKLSLKKTAAPIRLYVDGSCLGNSGTRTRSCPAGWGVVALEDDGTREMFAPVSLEPESEDYIGAAVASNNTAELSAMFHALEYTVRMKPREVEVLYDSEYAYNVVTGLKRAHANKVLVQATQQKLAEARELTSVGFSHVKAHSGDKYNDLADALAKRGATGDRWEGWTDR